MCVKSKNYSKEATILNFPKRKVGLALTLSLVLLLVLQVGLVLAHARLKTASVLPDAVLTAAPATLSVTFSEEVSETESKLSVLDSTGKQVDKGDLKVAGDTATVSLNALADGKYTVKFRSFTEDDSGVVDGQYTFTVAKSGTAAAGNTSAATQAESNLPATPNTGAGGGSSESGFNTLLVIMVLVVIGLGTTTLILRRRRA
jgi:methionine-rich copper-binding protein CopC